MFSIQHQSRLSRIQREWISGIREGHLEDFFRLFRHGQCASRTHDGGDVGQILPALYDDRPAGRTDGFDRTRMPGNGDAYRGAGKCAVHLPAFDVAMHPFRIFVNVADD